MTLGENICRARKRKKLTQADLAEKMNVSFQAVSSWEREEYLPDTYNFIQLGRVLEVSLDWLAADHDQ
jgi:GTP pyrophosphokinase